MVPAGDCLGEPIEANRAAKGRKNDDTRAGLLGSGVATSILAVILGVTVLVFLFWGGPLWRAPTGASHAGRIALSYVVAVPLLAMALRLQRRWSWVRLASATALLWGAKLVLTASVYPYLTPGSASVYAPARPWEGPPPAHRQAKRPYVAAAAIGSAGDIDGTVQRHRLEAGGVIVHLEDPPSGRVPAAPGDLAIHVEHSRYDRGAYLAHTFDRVSITNHDDVLHTLRISSGERTVRNVPLLPKEPARPLAALPTGSYRVGCENHPSERASLVVVDHPYATITDQRGAFELIAVAAGRHTIAFTDGSGSTRRPVELAPGERVHVTIDLGAAADTGEKAR